MGQASGSGQSQPGEGAGAAAGTAKGAVRGRGLVKRHGSTTVLHGVDLDIAAGEFFVLLGPSGSGKTTTLRILAGLETVSEGQVWLDGQEVTFAEPGERDVAMVFQSYALYPHMTVAQNIGFPLKMVGVPAQQVARAVQEAADRVSIGHLLGRRPGQLSGGQQQRVALARAIVRQPRLFLLDEPLSNLDAKLRLETRVELRRLQRALGVTTVYVTHDQEEAMTLADRMAVFIEGRIVQVGTPREVFGRPSCAAVACFIGTPPMNLLPAHWDDAGVRAQGLEEAPALPVAGTPQGAREVVLGVRPADLRLVAPGQGWPARVELVEELGDARIANLRAGAHALKIKCDHSAALVEGATVHLAFAAASAHLFSPTDGARLETAAAARA
jgi:ABC-type sugar transport system ATPase subunit